MTGRRLRLQAVVLAVVVVVSMVATGAAFAGTTVAQSNGTDNPAGSGGADNAGGGSGNGNAGSGDADNVGGGSGNGNAGSGGADNAGGGSSNSNAGSGGADNAGGGAGSNTTPGAGTPGGNGSGPGVDDVGPPANDRAANGAGPDIAEVVRQVSQATPDSAATVDIEDKRPDTPGITVTPGPGTETVSEVTLADENLRGTVDIKEYRTPPRAVNDSVARTVARNITRGPPANDSDGNGSDTNETAANASTDESASTDRVNVITVANISVFDENGTKASNTSATVRMSIDADEVTNPENATVVHETDDGWEELDTSVVDTTNETVTLAAETGGFSLFAVAEIEDDNEESTTSSGPGETGDTTPGFGVWIALAVIAGVTLLTWRSGR